nr:hypothetical protein [Tanacetum cinerariifolium]
MSKNPSIPRRNKFGALLPIELSNEEIRNSNAYKEYYAIATRAAPPKPKASVRRTKSSSDTSITPPTVAAAMTEAQQLKLVTKRSMQQTHKASGSGANEGTGSIPGVPDVPSDESKEELSWNSTNDEGDADEGKDGDGDDGKEADGDDDEDDDGKEGNNDDDDQEVKRDDDKEDEEEGGDDDQEYDKETRDEESFDPLLKTPKNSNGEGDGEEDIGLNVGGEERHVKEEEEDELYRDVNINQRRGIQATLEVEDSHVTLTLVNPDGMESIFETTSQMDVQTPTSVAPLPMSGPTMTPSTIATITTTSQAPILPTTFAGAVSAILGIIQRYMDQRMNEAVKVAVQIQSDRLRDKAQRENDEFLKTVDENMQKIIKEQVKEQVKVQVSKILPRIKQTVNEQLEAEVLTRSYHSSKTYYAVAADLFEMELKKILIEKIEGNNIYGETVTLKRRRDDDADKDEEPSAGPDRGSKRRREGKDHIGKRVCLYRGAYADHLSDGRALTSRIPPSLDHDWNKTVPATHESIQPWISELVKLSDSRSSFNELMDTPLDFSNFLINRLKVDTLTSKLIAGPTYELIKGSCKSLVELKYHLEEVFKATTSQLDWVNPEGQQYPHNLLKPLPLIPNNQGHRVIPFKHFINNDLEYLCGGFIYQNKDKKNRLMRIDELHKFSDGTLTDVRIALDDRLKGIRMQYLPQSTWRKSDIDRAAAMIQAIDKRLKTRRIMRSLERFVRGRMYEGDFRMLKRTI